MYRTCTNFDATYIVCAVWKISKIISSTWWTIWTALYCICTYQNLQHRHQNTDTFVEVWRTKGPLAENNEDTVSVEHIDKEYVF